MYFFFSDKDVFHNSLQRNTGNLCIRKTMLNVTSKPKIRLQVLENKILKASTMQYV